MPIQVHFITSPTIQKRETNSNADAEQENDNVKEIHQTGALSHHTIESLSSCLGASTHNAKISIKADKLTFQNDSTVACRTFLELSFLTALFTVPSELVSLDLRDCSLQDAFAFGLSNQLERRSVPALQKLRLAGNSISDQGAEALARTVPNGLEEFDLSRNRLTQKGILALGELLKTPARCPRLKVLHLACSSHCISLSTFQSFATIIEDNFSIQSLTIGHEVLNWFNDTVPTEWKEMDAFLAYWWLEPAYRSVTDRIRFLLVINHAFDGTKHSVHSVLSRVQPKQQAEAMYRMLKQNPLLLLHPIKVHD